MDIFNQRYNVGIDIQSNIIRIVVIKKHYNRQWRLVHWWSFLLPTSILDDDKLVPTAQLLFVLHRIQRSFNKNYSLRLALPATLLVEHDVVLPLFITKKKAIDWFITSRINHIGQIDLSSNVFTYQRQNHHTFNNIRVTIISKNEYSNWINCCTQAGLQLHLLSTTPCVFRTILTLLNVEREALFIYQCDSYLLWCTFYESDFIYKTMLINPSSGRGNTQEQIESIVESYQHKTARQIDHILGYIKSPSKIPYTVKFLNPFSLVTFVKDAIKPPCYAEFILAVGLALCEDTICCQ